MILKKKVNQNKKNRKIIQNVIIILIKKKIYPQYFNGKKKNYVKNLSHTEKKNSFFL